MEQTRNEAIRARCAAATPGPWETDGDLVVNRDGSEIAAVDPVGPILKGKLRLAEAPFTFRENLNFIVHAREDMPWLLEQLEQAQSDNRQLQEAIERTAREAMRLDWRTCEIGNMGSCPIGASGMPGMPSADGEPWNESLARLEMIRGVGRDVLGKIEWLEKWITEIWKERNDLLNGIDCVCSTCRHRETPTCPFVYEGYELQPHRDPCGIWQHKKEDINERQQANQSSGD